MKHFNRREAEIRETAHSRKTHAVPGIRASNGTCHTEYNIADEWRTNCDSPKPRERKSREPKISQVKRPKEKSQKPKTWWMD